MQTHTRSGYSFSCIYDCRRSPPCRWGIRRIRGVRPLMVRSGHQDPRCDLPAASVKPSPKNNRARHDTRITPVNITASITSKSPENHHDLTPFSDLPGSFPVPIYTPEMPRMCHSRVKYYAKDRIFGTGMHIAKSVLSSR